jgi:hypothetical protein
MELQFPLVALLLRVVAHMYRWMFGAGIRVHQTLRISTSQVMPITLTGNGWIPSLALVVEHKRLCVHSMFPKARTSPFVSTSVMVDLQALARVAAMTITTI